MKTSAGGPAARTRPSASRVTVSAYAPARVRSCSTATTASPARARSRAMRMTSSWWPRSRAAVGSSSNSTAARCASARASVTRACSPPESDGYRRSANRVTSQRSRTSATVASSRCCSGRPAHGARPIRTTSSTVNGKLSVLRWGSTARRIASSTADQPARGDPSISTVPATAGRSPLTAASRVDLPAPFGPTSACTSPARIRRSTPSSTGCPVRSTRRPATRTRSSPEAPAPARGAQPSDAGRASARL